MADTGGSPSTVLQTTELELKKEGEKEAEQNTVEQLERQMNQLFKLVNYAFVFLLENFWFKFHRRILLYIATKFVHRNVIVPQNAIKKKIFNALFLCI